MPLGQMPEMATDATAALGQMTEVATDATGTDTRGGYRRHWDRRQRWLKMPLHLLFNKSRELGLIPGGWLVSVGSTHLDRYLLTLRLLPLHSVIPPLPLIHLPLNPALPLIHLPLIPPNPLLPL